MSWIRIAQNAAVVMALCVGASTGYAASSFSASADVGMGGEFPCSLDFLSGGQFGKNVTLTNQLASAAAAVTLDCTTPPNGVKAGTQFVAEAAATAIGGRVRARANSQTGEDLAFMNLNPNYPHGTASASFANSLRINGPITGGAKAVRLRFRLSGSSDLGSSPFGPGVPWGFSGTSVDFGVTADSQAAVDDPNGPLVRFRDNFKFDSRSNANVPHDPVFVLNLFLTPGKSYLLTAGLRTFAQGGASANYFSTGTLEEIIAPAGYIPEIDGILLKQDGASFILDDAPPLGVKPGVSINLISTANPSIQGQDVTFGATVSASFTPTGTIQFKDGANTLGVPLALSGQNSASYTTATLGVGNHDITAIYSGDGNNASGLSSVLSQIVNVASSGSLVQTINFDALPNHKKIGDAAFGVSASASSGLVVSFTSQTSNVCSVSAATVTILAVGTCTIRASQGGDANYLPAANVDQSFVIESTANSESGGGGCTITSNGQFDGSLALLIAGAAVSIAIRRKRKYTRR